MKIIVGLILLIVLVLALRVGELYTQLARYQKYWNKVNQRPIAQDALIYVALGDSAAQGIGASRPDNGYVGVIAKELSAKRPVQLINFSKSGATINDVVESQLPKYESLKVMDEVVITVDIGANDVVRKPASDFEKDMDNLMSKLPKNTIIADIPSFQGSRYGRLEGRVSEANEIMYKLAEKHGFELAKVHERVQRNNGLRTFSADFFHPSDYGYRTNWAPAFLERINQN